MNGHGSFGPSGSASAVSNKPPAASTSDANEFCINDEALLCDNGLTDRAIIVGLNIRYGGPARVPFPVRDLQSRPRARRLASTPGKSEDGAKVDRPQRPHPTALAEAGLIHDPR
jgi:hypothetical protein